LSAQAAETQDNSPDTYEDTPVELVNFLLSEGSQVTSNFIVSSPVVQLESSQSQDASVSHDNISKVKENIFPVYVMRSVIEHPGKLSKVIVNGMEIEFEVDTGAGVSVMSESMFSQYFSNPTLSPVPVTLSTIAGEVVVPGQVEVFVKKLGSVEKSHVLPIIICQGSAPAVPLMGRQWLDSLYPEWRSMLCHNLSDKFDKESYVELLYHQYPNVFSQDASSYIKDFKASLNLEENAQPIFSKPYSVPYALMPELDKILDAWVAQGKIKPVAVSDWASPCFLIPKQPEGLRLVNDFKKTINKKCKRQIFPPPNPQTIFASLASAKVFCVVDMSEAYTQLRLDEKSQEIVVMNTPHRGLFRALRLMYGIASAPGIFQMMMSRLISGLRGVVAYLDDVLIFGSCLSECLENVHALLERFQQYNVRVNLAKCRWFLPQVEFLGFVISAESRRPSPRLVSAIVNAPQPQNVREVKAFLGLVTFYSQFLPNMSTLLYPLNQLTHADVPFVFSEECKKAFTTAKQILIKQGLLMHFDPKLEVVLIVDTSPVGAGAVLAHRVRYKGRIVERPVAFASLTFSPTQSRYSQIEKVWQ